MKQKIDLLALPVVNDPQEEPFEQDTELDLAQRRMERNSATIIPIRHLPPIVRDVMRNAAKTRRLPSFVTCMAIFGALLGRLRLRYPTEDKLSIPCLQVLIEGRQASGKGFAEAIEHLLVDRTMRQHDQECTKELQDYREEQQEVNGTEKLKTKPRVNIRCISPKISENELAAYLVNQEHLFDGETLPFWSFTPELDTAVKATKNSYSDLRAENRIGYDFGSHLVRHYSSANSVPCDSELDISLLYLGTPGAVDRYMDRESVEGGNVSRHIVCEIDDGLGAPPAIKKPYTQEQLRDINHWLDLIMDDTYAADGLRPVMELDMSWIDKDVFRWLSDTAEKVKESGSRAYNDFNHRASTSAFRIAAICYYLYLLELRNATMDVLALKLPVIQRRCKKIYRFMADYICDTLLERWGQEYDDMQMKIEERRGDARKIKGGIMKLLPETFTREMFEAAWKKSGNIGRPRQRLYELLHGGKIQKTDEETYRKI